MSSFLNFDTWWLNLDHVISVEFRHPEHGALECLITLTGHTTKHLSGADANRLEKYLHEHESAGRPGG